MRRIEILFLRTVLTPRLPIILSLCCNTVVTTGRHVKFAHYNAGLATEKQLCIPLDIASQMAVFILPNLLFFDLFRSLAALEDINDFDSYP